MTNPASRVIAAPRLPVAPIPLPNPSPIQAYDLYLEESEALVKAGTRSRLTFTQWLSGRRAMFYRARDISFEAPRGWLIYEHRVALAIAHAEAFVEWLRSEEYRTITCPVVCPHCETPDVIDFTGNTTGEWECAECGRTNIREVPT